MTQANNTSAQVGQAANNNLDRHRWCVIMCGGVGSRFWPYSRANYPKQFLDLFGTGRTLLQMTIDRLRPVVPIENFIIVTNAVYKPLIEQQLPELKPENILLEPARRNTAPCIAWASFHINAIDPQASIIVAPSDHLITRERDFEASVNEAFAFVEQHDALLTMGIKPTRPETGYGYIQVGHKEEGNISRVKTFTEKPNRELAQVFLDSGEFVWNSGIFFWRVSTVINAFWAHATEIATLFTSGLDKFGTDKEMEFIEQNFASSPAISVDYAILEKALNVYVETVSFGWSDLGSWNALYENSPKNREQNVTRNCSVLAYESAGNIFAVQQDKLVVVQGINDYVIADSGDVLLICPKDAEAAIRVMVNDAKLHFGEKYI
jgi:mannose-1-phosphate guanylyltransferase